MQWFRFPVICHQAAMYMIVLIRCPSRSDSKLFQVMLKVQYNTLSKPLVLITSHMLSMSSLSWFFYIQWPIVVIYTQGFHIT